MEGKATFGRRAGKAEAPAAPDNSGSRPGLGNNSLREHRQFARFGACFANQGANRQKFLAPKLTNHGLGMR